MPRLKTGIGEGLFLDHEQHTPCRSLSRVARHGSWAEYRALREHVDEALQVQRGTQDGPVGTISIGRKFVVMGSRVGVRESEHG